MRRKVHSLASVVVAVCLSCRGFTGWKLPVLSCQSFLDVDELLRCAYYYYLLTADKKEAGELVVTRWNIASSTWTTSELFGPSKETVQIRWCRLLSRNPMSWFQPCSHSVHASLSSLVHMGICSVSRSCAWACVLPFFRCAPRSVERDVVFAAISSWLLVQRIVHQQEQVWALIVQ